jgi:hypothetical protein
MRSLYNHQKFWEEFSNYFSWAFALTSATFLQMFAKCLAFNICFGILYLEAYNWIGDHGARGNS